MRTRLVAIGAFAVAATLTVATEGHAITLQECSANYKTAKAAGTLGGKTWTEYRKIECGLEAPAAAPRAANKKTDGTAPVTNFSSPWGAPQVGGRSSF